MVRVTLVSGISHGAPRRWPIDGGCSGCRSIRGRGFVDTAREPDRLPNEAGLLSTAAAKRVAIEVAACMYARVASWSICGPTNEAPSTRRRSPWTVGPNCLLMCGLYSSVGGLLRGLRCPWVQKRGVQITCMLKGRLGFREVGVVIFQVFGMVNGLHIADR